jgi:acetylornithine deacetylase/succinyl-diaminopimelate desuccinylase-like protein
MSNPDPVSLTKSLLRFDTVNPPGRERDCARLIGAMLGAKPEPRAQTYNTDAGNLLKVYKGVPTVVLGPGEAAQAHQTDEYVSMARVRQSVAFYEDLIRDWCRL